MSFAVPSTPDFVSGDQFDFRSPKGVMTRARRSSIYGARAGSAPATNAASRKMTLMPALKEEKVRCSSH